MREPEPGYPIAVAPFAGRVIVRFAGTIILTTRDALELREAYYPPVLYLPRRHADLGYFEPSAKKTHCPYKGDASYYGLRAGGLFAPDAVWSYSTPHEAVAAIAGRLAFNSERVSVEIARG